MRKYIDFLQRLTEGKRFHRNENLKKLNIKFLPILLSSLFIICLLDNLLHLSSTFRLILFSVFLSITLLYLFKLLRILFIPASNEHIAIEIERKSNHSENRVINALQLGRSDSENPFVEKIVSGSIDFLSSINLADIFKSKIKPVWKFIFPLSFISLIIYLIIFPKHAKNAMARVLNPFTTTPPISAVNLVVSPGDTAILKGEDLIVKLTVSGKKTKSAKIYFKFLNKKWNKNPMEETEDNKFVYLFKEVENNFKYKVKTNDATSKIYKVKVFEEPLVKFYEFYCEYPKYTKLQKRVIKKSEGNISILIGSKLSIKIISNNPLKKAMMIKKMEEIPLEVKGNTALSNLFTVIKDITYQIKIVDIYDFQNRFVPKNKIIAVKDEPPQLSIDFPGKNLILTTPTDIPLSLKIKDDFGIANYKLIGQINFTKPIILAYRKGENKKNISAKLILPLSKFNLKEGDSFFYWATAEDFNDITGPGKTSSKKYKISIVSHLEKLQMRFQQLIGYEKFSLSQIKDILRDITKGLREILKKQKEIRKETTEDASKSKLLQLAQQQLKLKIKTSEYTKQLEILADKIDPQNDVLKQRCILLKEKIENFRIIPLMSEVIADLEKFLVYFAQEREEEIIKKLEMILKTVEKLEKEIEKLDTISKSQAIKKMITTLDQFIKERSYIATQLKELKEKIDSDSLSEEDIKKLSEFAETERKMAESISKGTDHLRHFLQQEIDSEKLLEELETLYMHIERTAEKIKKEISTLTAEEMMAGLMLAEELIEDLEMYLPDKPDRKIWHVANPIEEYEVPLPELPPELTDMVGDLIETLEEMDEDMDNILTAGWADTLPQAGDLVADGPISNYSAKGKTGNVLPRNQEAGGRSGEGRAGKSVGEFVQKEFVGKKGRKIPPRISDLRMMKGIVEDKSRKSTASTGGGKKAGIAMPGMSVRFLAEKDEELKELTIREAMIRAQASKLCESLNPSLIAASQLREMIVILEEIDKSLLDNRYLNIWVKRKLLASKFLKVKKSLRELLELKKEVILTHEELPEDIFSTIEMEFPSRYRELIKDYFKKISRSNFQ